MDRSLLKNMHVRGAKYCDTFCTLTSCVPISNQTVMIAYCWQGTALQQPQKDQAVTSSNSLLHMLQGKKSLLPKVSVLAFVPFSTSSVISWQDPVYNLFLYKGP